VNHAALTESLATVGTTNGMKIVRKLPRRVALLVVVGALVASVGAGIALARRDGDADRHRCCRDRHESRLPGRHGCRDGDGADIVG
jgi:hypothetical protein